VVREYEAKGPTYRQARQRSFKASYTYHYRSGLIQILETLEFRSTNTVHRPVLEALELIKWYKAEHSPATLYYARGEHVPVDGVIPGTWRSCCTRPTSGAAASSGRCMSAKCSRRRATSCGARPGRADLRRLPGSASPLVGDGQVLLVVGDGGGEPLSDAQCLTV
jgi:hypothetical protein